jgi:hypothetical protein
MQTLVFTCVFVDALQPSINHIAVLHGVVYLLFSSSVDSHTVLFIIFHFDPSLWA